MVRLSWSSCEYFSAGMSDPLAKVTGFIWPFSILGEAVLLPLRKKKHCNPKSQTNLDFNELTLVMM